MIVNKAKITPLKVAPLSGALDFRIYLLNKYINIPNNKPEHIPTKILPNILYPPSYWDHEQSKVKTCN